MDVEPRQGSPARSHAFDLWKPRDERHESAATFHEHAAAALADEGNVAKILDRVPQRLVGPDEDGPSIQRAAVPRRLVKLAPSSVAVIVVPIELAPADGEVA